ncbi:GNAT family N-acetyltransferase [Saccharobesus litoralis]|uniref:GNAT family N-acetyltransferase n=1 Tax=Saccharobesus litoralis TaxID=2172099 RepID=A0A2S0VXA6_9ALTE|nr:GNAT family N-acetyltransferase [Saccharobesus litoralis]AWB66339.1 GNAT family N-acetyltransferase [Saccharobesus litoralis]AWB68841.1 GNAT family N-acetyltransferase [Saccharobesus litoralis]
MSQNTTYYLEMLEPEQLNAKLCPDWLAIKECVKPQAQLNQFLYATVGESWQWTEKRPWSSQVWQSYVERDNMRTWLALEQGSIVGYFELEKNADGEVEIMYLGLMPEYIGKGAGGALLTAAVEQAWAWQASRVWVKSNDLLEHPTAKRNYKKRGFKQYKRERNLFQAVG